MHAYSNRNTQYHETQKPSTPENGSTRSYSTHTSPSAPAAAPTTVAAPAGVTRAIRTLVSTALGASPSGLAVAAAGTASAAGAGWASWVSMGQSADAVAPERDLLMMIAASVLTINVMTNRTRPPAMSAEISLAPATKKWFAIMTVTELPPLSSTWWLKVKTGLRMKAITMVSPSARPRPSMLAPITPDLPYGSTTVRIMPHRVEPSA